MALAAGLVFAIIIAIFALQNAIEVEVRFFGWASQASLAVIILVSALAGAVIVGCLSFIRQLGQGFKARELRSKINSLESELKRLNDEKKAAQVQKPQQL